ncbi:hypothetical protein BDB00DRAFT_879027 [Zychaea mexicana]|uniref:uncharacterized protein n=1 Tax=Zychaea mexicana TaxID=64656 RepID=UPI0022FDBAC9|nr:uncharacterized protein BDB00DRAFT_879027 [Zychaea mexicana]KAI9482618.1 hypothetical protein BDB00DRAFT_879027 [Zychaea mexicana]
MELTIAHWKSIYEVGFCRKRNRGFDFDLPFGDAYNQTVALPVYEALHSEAATRPHIQDWARFVKGKFESHFKYKKGQSKKEQPDVEAENKARRRRQRALRKLQRRTGVFEAQQEDCTSLFSTECVQVLSFDYMSEDETDAEETASSSTQQQERWMTKRPSWRSRRATAFLEHLVAPTVYRQHACRRVVEVEYREPGFLVPFASRRDEEDSTPTLASSCVTPLDRFQCIAAKKWDLVVPSIVTSWRKKKSI